jgi:hypothetical protein
MITWLLHLHVEEISFIATAAVIAVGAAVTAVVGKFAHAA